MEAALAAAGMPFHSGTCRYLLSTGAALAAFLLPACQPERTFVRGGPRRRMRQHATSRCSSAEQTKL